jgi:ABC-type transport system substrate-binding protein
VPRAELATVLLRPGSPQLADQATRAAVAAAIDRPALIATGTGDGPSTALTANSLVTAPTQAGYVASMPAGAPGANPAPAQVPALLAQAGYVSSGGQWTRAGRPLSLVIAAPAGREPYVSIANQLKSQLQAAGIAATTVTPDSAQLYEQLLNPSTAGTNGGTGTIGQPIDIVVGPQPAGADPATELASWFGCAAGSATGQAPVSTSPLGWCDPAVQPSVDAALTGDMSVSDALARVEPALWAEAVEIPLFQVSDELAIGPLVSGVDSGPPMAGPFFGAATWNRTNG